MNTLQASESTPLSTQDGRVEGQWGDLGWPGPHKQPLPEQLQLNPWGDSLKPHPIPMVSNILLCSKIQKSSFLLLHWLLRKIRWLLMPRGNISHVQNNPIYCFFLKCSDRVLSTGFNNKTQKAATSPLSSIFYILNKLCKSNSYWVSGSLIS